MKHCCSGTLTISTPGETSRAPSRAADDHSRPVTSLASDNSRPSLDLANDTWKSSRPPSHENYRPASQLGDNGRPDSRLTNDTSRSSKLSNDFRSTPSPARLELHEHRERVKDLRRSRTPHGRVVVPDHMDEMDVMPPNPLLFRKPARAQSANPYYRFKRQSQMSRASRPQSALSRPQPQPPAKYWERSHRNVSNAWLKSRNLLSKQDKDDNLAYAFMDKHTRMQNGGVLQAYDFFYLEQERAHANRVKWEVKAEEREQEQRETQRKRDEAIQSELDRRDEVSAKLHEARRMRRQQRIAQQKQALLEKEQQDEEKAKKQAARGPMVTEAVRKNQSKTKKEREERMAIIARAEEHKKLVEERKKELENSRRAQLFAVSPRRVGGSPTAALADRQV